MKSFLKNIFLFVFLVIAFIPSVVSSASSTQPDCGYKSLEDWILNTSYGQNYVYNATEKMNELLKAIDDNNGEKFLQALEGATGERNRASRKDMCRLPLKIHHKDVSQLKKEEDIQLKYFAKDTAFNLLQIAVKAQKSNIVSAILALCTEYNINQIGKPTGLMDDDTDYQKDNNDLLMLTVNNMQNEDGLNILGMLIAEGVTCENRRYPSDKFSRETPLTLLMKRELVSRGKLSADLVVQGALILINAGFDPYEERCGEPSPFVQAVAKKCQGVEMYDTMITMSIKCFGGEHEKVAEKSRARVNSLLLLSKKLTKTSYEAIAPEALAHSKAHSNIVYVEAIVQVVRHKLLEYRKEMIGKVSKGQSEDFWERSYAKASYAKLIPRWKLEPLRESIKELKKMKNDAKQMGAQKDLLASKEKLMVDLEKEIIRRKLLLGDNPFHHAVQRILKEKPMNEYYCRKGEEEQPDQEINKGLSLVPATWHEVTKDLKARYEVVEQQLRAITQPQTPPVKSSNHSHQPPSLPPQNPPTSSSAHLQTPPPTETSSQGSPGTHSSTQPAVTRSQLSTSESNPATTETDEDGHIKRSNLTRFLGFGLLAGGVVLGLGFLIKKLRLRSHDQAEEENKKEEEVYQG